MTAGILATTQAVISLRDVISRPQTVSGEVGQAQFTASLIVAGQIAGMEPRLFLIYPEGNFIKASLDTPFFQIGETKYGRPIILRGYDRAMSLEEAIKLLFVSFDSPLKANLSVGLPLDLLVLGRDQFEPMHQRRITVEDPYCQAISTGWGQALKKALYSLPDYTLT